MACRQKSEKTEQKFYMFEQSEFIKFPVFIDFCKLWQRVFWLLFVGTKSKIVVCSFSLGRKGTKRPVAPAHKRVFLLPAGQLGAYTAFGQVRPLDTPKHPFINALKATQRQQQRDAVVRLP